MQTHINFMISDGCTGIYTQVVHEHIYYSMCTCCGCILLCAYLVACREDVWINNSAIVQKYVIDSLDTLGDFFCLKGVGRKVEVRTEPSDQILELSTDEGRVVGVWVEYTGTFSLLFQCTHSLKYRHTFVGNSNPE